MYAATPPHMHAQPGFRLRGLLDIVVEHLGALAAGMTLPKVGTPSMAAGMEYWGCRDHI